MMEKCVHLWVLPSTGNLIRGVCRKCGVMKLFRQQFGDKLVSKGWFRDAEEAVGE